MTLNVQHLESLNEVAAQITAVIHESLLARIVRKTSDIVPSDLAPAELIHHP